MSEYDLQKACVTWFRYKYENSGKGMLISIPNEGRRNENTGKRLKSTGLATGAPDLFIIKKGSPQILFIEMKTKHRLSGLSEAQIEFHLRLRYMGQIVFVCRSLDDFIRIVENWFNRK